jgi:polyphosphate kinase
MPKKDNVLINRELSWLAFNERVLQEAADKSVPLLERIKFLGIYSNNRDEFFRVRVATIKRLEKHHKKAKGILNENPRILLEKIQHTVIAQQARFEQIYQKILSEFGKEGIAILNERQLDTTQEIFVRKYFREKVMPTLFPIMLGNYTSFPYLKDHAGYLVIKLGKNNNPGKTRYALIEVPTDLLSRFLVLPKSGKKTAIILLDDVIRFNLDDIFSNFDYDFIEAYNIKLTRDAELDIDNDLSRNFLEKVARSLKARKKGLPVRLVYDHEIAPDILDFILKKIKLGKEDNVIPGGRYHNFKDFISFPNVGRTALSNKPQPPVLHPDLKGQSSILKVIKRRDVLLTYPYQSFGHLIDLLREASIDPKVLSIHITLYRVAKNSNIVLALINAIKNGKKVVAVIELTARFDEESNIFWARKLQEEGATVIFGVPKLKVHSKLFLIARREHRKIVNYAHVGTGNFNGDTARVYTDHSLLTADKRITDEVERMFAFYENNRKKGTYQHLLVSPFHMRKKILAHLNKEIRNAKSGKPAFIFMKLNNLVDEEMIFNLYEASSAGVKIRLLIRGICSLVAGVKGLSENIEARSIIDRYLEHSRVLVFCNGGDEKYYLSSADLMTRNLDHRSEVAVPLYNKRLRLQLRTMLNILWDDNVKSRVLDSSQNNQYRKKDSSEKVRAQEEMYEYFKNQENGQI